MTFVCSPARETFEDAKAASGCLQAADEDTEKEFLNFFNKWMTRASYGMETGISHCHHQDRGDVKEKP